VTQHRFFSNLWVWLRLNVWRNEWNSTSTCCSPAVFTWTTTVIVTVLHIINFWFGHFSGGGSFQFDIDNIGGMVLHRVALWSKNAILHYVICERPQSDFESLHNLAERYLEPVREANKTSNLSVQLEAIYTRRWIPYDALSSIILCQRHSGSCATLAA